MKKTAITLLFTLGSGLVLGTAANAEPFNDQSVIVGATQANSDGQSSTSISGYSFNDRSQEFIVAEPAGVDQPRMGSMVTRSYETESPGNS